LLIRYTNGLPQRNLRSAKNKELIPDDTPRSKILKAAMPVQPSDVELAKVQVTSGQVESFLPAGLVPATRIN
jgi:hypothetical protein